MRPTPVSAEGAVADHLGIEAAVVGEIDLLGHEAVEGGADGGDGLVWVDGEGGGRRLGEARGGGKQECCEKGGMGKRFLRHRQFSLNSVTGQYNAQGFAGDEAWLCSGLRAVLKKWKNGLLV